MKKYNQKQKDWAVKQNTRRKRKLGGFIAAFILLFALVISTGMYAEGSIDLSDMGKLAAPVTTATIMGAIGSIDRVPNDERTGKAINDKLFILSADQVNEDVAFPTRVGIELGNIPISAGEYWHYIRSVIDSPEAKSTGEEGDNASLITNELTFVVGGMPESIIKLLENGIGEAFYVVWQKCATNDKWIGGNACKPLKLVSFEGGSTKDFTGYTITFKNECGEVYSKYTGNTPLQSPDTVAADATSITLTSNPTYRLTDGSAATVHVTTFSAVTDADVGRIVTIFGPSSTPTHAPDIATGSDFLLIAGETWAATLNAAISFKIFKDAASGYKFMEIAGSRI